MHPKYLVLGKGYLGERFHNKFPSSILSDARINSIADAKKEIEKYNPDVIINCIGKTGKPNIDWCEDHKSETIISNVLVPTYIAIACQELNKKMVHLSSGCIYEGDNNGKGFSEEDIPNFHGSFYSRTKIIAENILKEFPVLLVRIRMPLDIYPDSRNLLTKILGYSKIISVENSITIIDDLLIAIDKLVNLNQTGIFNVTNPGSINHKELLSLYEKASGKKLSYSIIDLNELHSFTKAKRSNCILSTKKLESLGIKLPAIKEAAKETIEQYVSNEVKK